MSDDDGHSCKAPAPALAFDATEAVARSALTFEETPDALDASYCETDEIGVLPGAV